MLSRRSFLAAGVLGASSLLVRAEETSVIGRHEPKVLDLFERYGISPGESSEVICDLILTKKGNTAYVMNEHGLVNKYRNPATVHVIPSSIGVGATTKELVVDKINEKIEDNARWLLAIVASTNKVITSKTITGLNEKFRESFCKTAKLFVFQCGRYHIAIDINMKSKLVMTCYKDQPETLVFDDQTADGGFYGYMQVGLACLRDDVAVCGVLR